MPETNTPVPIALETQEAGTGKWFPIVTYSPGTDAQVKDAESVSAALRMLGLYARVVKRGVTS